MTPRKGLEIGLYVLIVVAVGAVAAVLALRGEGEKAYRDRILSHRREIDAFMRRSPESPLPPELRGEFSGLQYFPPDPAYRVEARVTPTDATEVITVPTSDGNLERYRPYGYAEFSLQGGRHRLLLLKSEEEPVSNRLFLPFRDQTSGQETYGGGRYLNVYLTRDGTVTLDFNLAYNPYCVYNYAYSCPLPPPENRLEAAVRAGEKNYTGPTAK